MQIPTYKTVKSASYRTTRMTEAIEKERRAAPDIQKLAWGSQLDHGDSPSILNKSPRTPASDKAVLRPQ